MKGETVAFRCNAGPTTGFGHLMRCRELARSLSERGVASVIFGPADAHRTTADAALFADWYAVDEMKPRGEESGEFLSFCRDAHAEHAILDDYRVESTYQRTLHEAGIRCLHQFDASAPPTEFWAPIVVNANPYENERAYLGKLRAPSAQLLLGPAYAVLRPEFRSIEPRAPRAQVSRILITFGAGDDRGMILRTLEALWSALSESIEIYIVSGKHNPRNPEIAKALKNRYPRRATLYIDPPSVAKLMNDADLAVMAGGTSTYEAASCGLPMVLVVLTSNQINPCRGWALKTGVVNLGEQSLLRAKDIRSSVLAFIEDDDRRIVTANRCRQAVDGKGGDRLLDALLKEETV